MKIVIIGGSGLIGSNLAGRLARDGHTVVPASPNTGVNTITGEGLAAALAGAEVVVDVANSPSFEDRAVLEFFQTSGRNLLAAESVAGVRHHLALSVVGTDRLPDSGYLRAKLAQERLIVASGIPYTILRATQFFEFVDAIVASAAEGDVIRLSPALFRPIAADDVAAALADLVTRSPLNGIVEVAGPDAIPLDKAGRMVLAAKADRRRVIADVHARYFGTVLDDRSLTPGDNPRRGTTRFETWLDRVPVGS
ncbi:SDR family oxidoreductase [Oceanibacterium hippocampi]|uniref:RmlD substrate binding domain protein n=1 Tax=Oceanibacterium hippocampi TaxID=745714 RepID=A0A1Y5TBK8_9PROT|nr:SDR family oxidoreductase [Oceanibacterium hippocampi]SLN56694.1 RmlD substrate binding domain protein [Oceanibacterium hippocampi]